MSKIKHHQMGENLIASRSRKIPPSSDSHDSTSNFIHRSGYDIQPTLGFGTTYEINSTRALTLDLTYMRGLVSFLKGTNGSIYNEGFVISGGMIF